MKILVKFLSGWEVCSFTLELFIGDLKLVRLEVRLFYLGDNMMVLQNLSIICGQRKVEHVHDENTPTVLILCGTLRKLCPYLLNY